VIAGQVLVAPIGLFAVAIVFRTSFTWDDLRFYAFSLVPILFAYLTYRYFSYRLCREIRLADDGTCGLDTSRRTVRLHVNEITKVKYHRKGDEHDESYTIHFVGGKLNVRDRMGDFPDFLARLKALNPAVDLATFPTHGWPSRSAPSEGCVGIAAILFPACVIGVLALLAIRTLQGG
jgi:hypothetical protein